MPTETLILVLAIDRGAGPAPLTEHRTKAAVPFGGKFRVIDFTLANCLHSGLRQVLVLTQYKSHSLHKHLRDGWSIFNPELREFITPVPPQMRESQEWYAGPFDAIRQNRYLIERNRASQILVLDGGAVYRMDYAELVRAHAESKAEITVAVRAVRARLRAHRRASGSPRGSVSSVSAGLCLSRPRSAGRQRTRPSGWRPWVSMSSIVVFCSKR